jgi:hypothetical protein
VIVAHHLSPVSIAVELVVVVGLLALFGSIWLKERRRRLRRGGTAVMRDAPPSAAGDESTEEE